MNRQDFLHERYGKGSARKKALQFVVILAAIVIIALVARIIITPLSVRGDSGYRTVMGTIAHIIVTAPDTKTAGESIEAAFEVLTQVNAQMSDYDPASQLSEVNREAFKKEVVVSAELFEVITSAVEYSKKTEGAFDITIGPVVDLWRWAEKEKRKPTDAEFAQAQAKVGFEKLILDSEKKTVKFTVEGMRLDLGGIAKGYAIDKAIEALQQAGAVGGMIDVGGDIRCFGTQPDGKGWVIGLQDPQVEGSILLKLSLADSAVATSGDYRRFVVIEGDRYSHIFNPSTSTSAGELSSVTIIAPTAITADALATAASVMGKQKALALIESIPDTEAIIIAAASPDSLMKTSGADNFICQ